MRNLYKLYYSLLTAILNEDDMEGKEEGVYKEYILTEKEINLLN